MHDGVLFWPTVYTECDAFESCVLTTWRRSPATFASSIIICRGMAEYLDVFISWPFIYVYISMLTSLCKHQSYNLILFDIPIGFFTIILQYWWLENQEDNVLRECWLNPVHGPTYSSLQGKCFEIPVQEDDQSWCNWYISYPNVKQWHGMMYGSHYE